MMARSYTFLLKILSSAVPTSKSATETTMVLMRMYLAKPPQRRPNPGSRAQQHARESWRQRQGH
eukprot:5686447-Amphidinium_carterae.3